MEKDQRPIAYDPDRLRRTWDAQQQYHIPEREQRFDVMLNVLATALPKHGRVVDLGCGTGSLSERILHRFPRVRVWALEYDPVLLKIGRDALGDARGRLTWVEADLRRRSWPGVLPRGRFDAAVSTTALHWLTREELRRLVRGLADRLRSGGVFLNGDAMPFDYPPGRERYPTISRVARAVRGEGSSRRPGPGVLTCDEWWMYVSRFGALRQELAERRRRYPSAHETVPPPSAEWLIANLRRHGFREAATVWQLMTNRVLLAVR